MKSVVQLLLATILLICLFKMPHGYYQFVRVSGMVGFGWLFYQYTKDKMEIRGLFCLLVAILLNPLVEIHFIKKTWNVIDVVLASILLIFTIEEVIRKKNH